MGVPEIIMVCLLAMNVGTEAVRHGHPREGTHSVWASLVGKAITIGLLIWGGFFR